MKKRLMWTSLALLPLAVWLGAQVQNATAARKTLAEITPGNALVWIEAKNLKGMVASWNGSQEKKTWLDSSTYQSYMRSKLALRLEEVRKAYADGIGVNPGFELLENVAGGESAVAVYDVGKLELLYLTRLPVASIGQTLLMRGRAKFQARNAGGQAYYVKSTSDGTVAFAAVGDLLIAGSREDLVAGALQLLAGQQRPAVKQERWFADALSKASAAGAPDVRMLVNLERAVKTAHFRSYWIQQNVTEMSQYYAAVSDLQMGAGAWTEQRSLLRRESRAAVDESGVAKLAKFVPADAGFYQAWAKPSSSQVETLLSERIVPRGGSGATNPEDQRAPGAVVESAAGSEEQLEDRVDVIESGVSNNASPLPIVKLAGSVVDAAAQIQATRASAGGVLVGIDSALVLLGSANWDENAVKSAVQASAERAWSVGTLTWNRRRAATWELSGLQPMQVWMQGNVLVIANSAGLMDKVVAGNGRAPQGAYVSGYRHGAEREIYGRVMGHIDNPQFPATEKGTTRAPMLFSETLGDLGKILQRVDVSTMEVRDDGAVVKQTVVYRKRP